MASAGNRMEQATEGLDVIVSAPLTWELSEGDARAYTTITASSLEEALEEARSGVDRANYAECEGTLWIDVRVRCVETDEIGSDTVTLAPEEPGCSESAHDWRSPIEIVGGCKENPGVRGNGGGVILREVCVHCGCERETNTWATNPSNGTQGHESISYEPAKYADEIAALASRKV